MEWGEGALDRLVGMFAFALYDARDRKLVLARDRYGIKPLYFLRWDDRLLFSSEAKALMQLDRPPRVNQQRLHEWLLYRNPDALTPDTLIDDIESVMPGELLEVRPGREPRRAKYYESTTHVKRSDFESNERLPSGRIVDELDEALNEAVRQRLVSDVPVGTLCSGGLDSSLITAMAAQYTRDLTAFHVSIAEAPSLDERKWVTELTNQLHIPLATRELDGQGFRENLTRAGVLFGLASHPSQLGGLSGDL